MKHGDLVKLREPGRKNWVVIKLTRQQIARERLNAPLVTGLYLCSGYWYPGSPLSHQPYGKLVGPVTAATLNGRVVGRVRGHRAAHKHLR